MKERKDVSKALYSILVITVLLFVWSLSHQFSEAKSSILAEVYPCLQKSIETYVKHKTKDAYYDIQYRYDPKKGKTGEYETRTAKLTDTTFTYRSKIVDPATHAVRSLQTAFLETNQLYADSIQIILDSLLQEKNIYVQSIIGVTSSFRTNKNEWSKDTTAININYRTSLTNQGSFEHINYYAYIHYSPYTIWRLMDKAPISILLIFNIIIIFTLIWWRHKRKRGIVNDMDIPLKDENYGIKDIQFNTNGKMLILGNKEIKLPTQLYELSIMFLEAEEHRVEKKKIKLQFWPKNLDSTSNMTSAISRLNKTLKNSNFDCVISTDPKDEEYYILTLNQKQNISNEEIAVDK